MIIRARGAITPAMIRGVLREFTKGTARRKKLHDYYLGEHAIARRHKKNQKAANRKIVVNRASYIVKIATGYLVGSPVSYASEEQEKALAKIREAYQAINIETVDAELARDASTYGKAVELLYANAQSQPRTAALDPRVAFVVYDDTVAQDPFFGVHIMDKQDENGDIIGLDIAIYDEHEKCVFQIHQAGGLKNITSWEGVQLKEDAAQREAHVFGAVPMVEYWNNAEERGDFEDVLSLIDAYNLLTSDRVNDKEQFVNALLVLMGITLGNTKTEANENFREVSQDGYLEIPAISQGADVKYVVKQLNEADTQVLADSLVSDIHTISMVPNLSDEHFASTASGVALRYKLLAFEQMTKEKERWFREGLESRLDMFARFLSVQSKIPADFSTDKVQMTFTRGLPVNELETAQTISLLRDIIPDEILRTQVPFVDRSKDLDAMMEKQRKQQAEQNNIAWGQRPAEQPKQGGVANAQPSVK